MADPTVTSVAAAASKDAATVKTDVTSILADLKADIASVKADLAKSYPGKVVLGALAAGLIIGPILFSILKAIL